MPPDSVHLRGRVRGPLPEVDEPMLRYWPSYGVPVSAMTRLKNSDGDIGVGVAVEVAMEPVEIAVPLAVPVG